MKGWLLEQFERSKKNVEACPPEHRPRVIVKPKAAESTRFVCRCGHPGLGCHCHG